MNDHLRAILKGVFGDGSASQADEFRAACSRVRPADWGGLLPELESHRLAPLVGYTARRLDLESAIPSAPRERLRESYRAAFLFAELQSRALRDILVALRAGGVEPIIFKGLVLSGAFYPDRGTRPMVDVDFLVAVSELKRTVRALRKLGYTRRIRDGVVGPNGFVNPFGVVIDLHWQFDLFAPDQHAEITEDRAIRELGEHPIRSWEPNAMLVHLVYHLVGHREGTGINLGWLVDIGFLVRSDGDRMNVDAIRRLAPTDACFAMVWRILAFLERDCGVELPAHLAQQAALYEPLSLPRILRESRLRPWGLPGLVGAGRFLFRRVFGGSTKRRNPTLTDLALAITDRIQDRRADSRAIATVRTQS